MFKLQEWTARVSLRRWRHGVDAALWGGSEERFSRIQRFSSSEPLLTGPDAPPLRLNWGTPEKSS
jgi:hypothetical protein